MPLLRQLSPHTKATLRSAWNRVRFPRVSLGRDAYVQPPVSLARDLRTGEHCAILRGSELLPGTRLGDHVVIGSHARVGRSELGAHCTLEPSVELFNSTLADHVQLQRGVSATDVRIGRYSYVAREAYLNLAVVGAFCSIGPAVLIGLGEHPIDLATTSPAFYSTRRQCGATFARADTFPERQPIVIGNDVWIGARAFIRDGVTIGHGAVVAAGAVVTRNVPPYAIVGGTPAKLIRSRFSEDVVARLLALAWWTWPDERLQAAQPYLAGKNIEALFEWTDGDAPHPAEAVFL